MDLYMFRAKVIKESMGLIKTMFMGINVVSSWKENKEHCDTNIERANLVLKDSLAHASMAKDTAVPHFH